MTIEDAQQNAKILGKKIEFTCLMHYIEAEYTEKIEKILKLIEKDELKIFLESNWPLGIDLALKMSINLTIGGKEENATRYLQDFNDRLFNAIVERLCIKNDIPVISHCFNAKEKCSSYQSRKYVKERIDYWLEFCENRKDFAREKNSAVLKTIIDKLKKLKEYLDRFEYRLGKYQDSRITEINKIKHHEAFLRDYNRFLIKEGDYQSRNSEIETNITEIEKDILGKIIR